MVLGTEDPALPTTLAEESYQRSVRNDSSISLDSRSTVSTILDDVLRVMEQFISRQWVQTGDNVILSLSTL